MRPQTIFSHSSPLQAITHRGHSGSVLFLECTHTPGPLHLLFLLPGMTLLQISAWLIPASQWPSALVGSSLVTPSTAEALR